MTNWLTSEAELIDIDVLELRVEIEFDDLDFASDLVQFGNHGAVDGGKIRSC